MTSMNLLAETLAKNGLASSQTEAIRMAQNIISTEKKVMNDFDVKANKIDEGLSNTKEEPKTYQEEIDELIEKTDPSRKDYNVMVSGYKKDQTMKEVDQLLAEVKADSVPEPVGQVEPEPVKQPELVVQESIPEPVVEQKVEAPEQKVDPVAQVSAFNELDKPVEEVSAVDAALASTPESIMPKEDLVVPDTIQPIAPQPIAPPTFDERAAEKKEVFTNQAITDAVSNAKPVYTDAVDGNKMLKELMDEQANEVYSNIAVDQTPSEDVEAANLLEKPELDEEEIDDTPEYNVYNIEPEAPKEEPMSNAPLPSAPIPQIEADEFILPVSDEPEPAVQEAPEELAQSEPEPEPKKEFKNPIDKVDLMDHFKFG